MRLNGPKVKRFGPILLIQPIKQMHISVNCNKHDEENWQDQLDPPNPAEPWTVGPFAACRLFPTRVSESV